MRSACSHAVRHRHRPLLLLCLTAFLLLALLPSANAMIASRALRNSRIGNTYQYSMYDGTVVTGESFVTGTTTYPYVFDGAMNMFVVRVLQQYLNFSKKTATAVGGSLATCMDTSGGLDATGKKCYKALLAAIAPSDCPAANVLCCPLAWRVRNQNIETTMAQMDPETIFWNGATVVNGFFANFSESYLLKNNNCSRQLVTGTKEISLAVDMTGEWRFVPLMTTFVLKETVLAVNATGAAKYFSGANPQDSINAAKTAQRPLYHIIDKILMPVVVCGILLIVIGLFLVLSCGCGTMRNRSRVRRTQQKLIELKSTPPPRGSIAILNDISPESSSRSSSEESRRSKRRSVSRAGSRRATSKSGAATDSDDESASSGSGSASHENRSGASRKASAKSKGSSKSLKSKASAASCKSSTAKSKSAAPFPPPPAPLPGIRPRKGSAQLEDAPSQAASTHLAHRPSSTATVVHQVGNPPRANSRRSVR